MASIFVPRVVATDRLLPLNRWTKAAAPPACSVATTLVAAHPAARR